MYHRILWKRRAFWALNEIYCKVEGGYIEKDFGIHHNNGGYMNGMTDFLLETFSFMKTYGFQTMNCNEKEHIISFIMPQQKLTVYVDYNQYEYELLCYFMIQNKYAFSLHEAISFAKIPEKKGTYQVSNHDELTCGIKYIANSMLSLFQITGQFNEQILLSICEYTNNIRGRQLEQYYQEIDITQAEECWKRGDYETAKQLFEKHRDELSESQRLKLKYAKKRSTSDLIL